jgi:hypothetical protein
MALKLSRSITGWATLGAICVACWGLAGALRLLDRVLEPWMYANPPLIGDWQGEAQAGNMRLRLVVSLTLNPNRSKQDGTQLRGRVVLCDSTGRVQSYPLEYGVVKDRQGRSSELRIPGHAPDEAPGLRPDSVILLNWDGNSTIRGQIGLLRVLPGGIIRMSSADPETGHPIEFLLHRTRASKQTCTAPSGSPGA